MGTLTTVPNPASPRALRPVEVITDRAKRYRAQANVPTSGKYCSYCGTPKPKSRPLDVDHIDGDESNGNPENLAHACRPCNTAKGNAFQRTGKGTRTRQYNPKERRPQFEPSRQSKPRKSAAAAVTQRYQKYIVDIKIARGYFEGDRDAAWDRVMNDYTPEERSQYAARLWGYRRKIGATRTGKQSEIPF